jgi:hypothetical protein
LAPVRNIIVCSLGLCNMDRLCILVLICLLIAQVQAGKGRVYKDEETVSFYVNKLAPYANPSETYEFYSLPFCHPEQIQHKHASLGEHLEGDAKSNALYNIKFKVNAQLTTLCTKHLKAEEIQEFKDAIKKYYEFEMLLDDLPMRGFVGTLVKDTSDKHHYYLFKHLHFTVEYNNNQVIRANVTTDTTRIQELGDEKELMVEFTYSVKWLQTNTSFADRMSLYSEKSELEIHWISIMNSFVLVILLTGFLAIILMRVLKNDYNRYARTEDGDEEQDDYGWKLVHGDVFRFPPNKNVFSALFGTGAQSLAVTIFILILAVYGMFYPHNSGALPTAAIFLYAFTAGIAGFVSANFYKKMGGEGWAWNIVLTASVFAVPAFVTAAFVNSVASYYGTTSALDVSIVLTVFFIWALVGFPLTLIGGIAGRRLSGEFYAPCRTKNFQREIPPIPWYRRSLFQVIMAGFLPFSAIYIELYYIYSSVWGHSSYTLFGILFLVFIILIIVTACITVALTYFQLSMEDHRWWWRSFISGGSTGFFIYAYSIFYFYYRSQMSGFFQATYYYGYMFVVCYFFFIMLGTVGFYSSLIFVRQIYKNLKID